MIVGSPESMLMKNRAKDMADIFISYSQQDANGSSPLVATLTAEGSSGLVGPGDSVPVSPSMNSSRAR